MKKQFFTIIILSLFLTGCSLTPNSNNTNSSPTKNIVINKTNKLDLSSQNLSKVPDNTFKQTNLQELDISNNKLTGSLQAEIRHLQNLRVLNMSNNHLTGVPAEIGQLSKLEILDLSNNQLTGLPNELGNLKNLKTLNISGNNYSAQDLEVIKKRLASDVNIIK
ncbi:MAG: leucine-rich repeat domain-containing protein [Patescibacteria group bacterium]|nr:leucine-rich repeat domain-containing protein [Patescibacteria group bacterium]